MVYFCNNTEYIPNLKPYFHNFPTTVTFSPLSGIIKQLLLALFDSTTRLNSPITMDLEIV